MPDFKIDNDNRLRDYSGREYGQVDSNNVVWGINNRAGYLKDGSYIGEDGHYLGQVWGITESKPNSSYLGSFSGPGSGSDIENSLIGIILLIALVVLFIWAIILLTPILAPIFFSSAETARKRRDKSEYEKWNGWAGLTSVVAILLVLGIASFVGINAFTICNNFLLHIQLTNFAL